MRKVILPLFLGLFLLTSGTIQAQRGLKLGAFAMPTLTSLFNSVDDELLDPPAFRRELLGGMSGGIVLGWNPSPYFGMRLNVVYAQQGARFSEKTIGSGLSTCSYNGEKYSCTRSTTRLEYVKVPFMIGFHTNDQYAKVMWSVYAGAQAGYLVRANVFNDDTSFEPPIPANITDYPDAYELYETFDYSLVAETGFDIKLVDELVLNLHLRGEYSLLDAENKDASYRVTTQGKTTRVNYWQTQRGNSLEAETQNVSVGLLIGVTYTFEGSQVGRPIRPQRAPKAAKVKAPKPSKKTTPAPKVAPDTSSPDKTAAKPAAKPAAKKASSSKKKKKKKPAKKKKKKPAKKKKLKKKKKKKK